MMTTSHSLRMMIRSQSRNRLLMMMTLTPRVNKLFLCLSQNANQARRNLILCFISSKLILLDSPCRMVLLIMKKFLIDLSSRHQSKRNSSTRVCLCSQQQKSHLAFQPITSSLVQMPGTTKCRIWTHGTCNHLLRVSTYLTILTRWKNRLQMN